MAVSEEGSEDDFLAVKGSTNSAVSGGVVIAAGALTALLGVQTFTMLQSGALANGVGGAFLLFGVPNLVFGWNVRKVRGWAAQGALISCTCAALCSGAWAIYLLTHAVFSPLAFLVVPMNVGALVAARSRIEPGKRADAARVRLAEQGLDAGL